MTKKLFIVLGILCVAAILAVSGGMLLNILNSQDKETIVIKSQNIYVDSKDFNISLNPAEKVSRTYTIQNNTGVQSQTVLSIKGYTSQDNGLGDVLMIKIVRDGTTEYSGLVKDWVNVTPPILPFTTKETSLVIEFSIPEEVGNEYQNKSISVKLSFAVSTIA